MNITKLKLENFRNYDSQEIEFNKGINVIYGDNAQGKTNILESEEILKNDLKEKYFKIKECLLRSGNLVSELSNLNDIENLFSSLLNTRKNLNKKIIK